MGKIAVTGATGFIGSNLISEILKSDRNEVAVFDRNKHSLSDVNSLKPLLTGCSIIYHLAGINASNHPDIYKTNVVGTAGLLDAVRRYSPKAKFIFSSSFAVYKAPVAGEIVGENHPVSPDSYYGFTKMLSEEIIRSYSRVYGIDTRILRISNVYGPGMPPLKHSVISTFLNCMIKEEKVVINGNGRQTRDFVYLDDVVRAFLLTGKGQFKGETINICSGEEVSINRLVDMLAKKLKKNVVVGYNKKNNKDVSRWKGNYNNATEILGWKPKVSLDAGLNIILKTKIQ